LFIELWIEEIKNKFENKQWEADFILNLLSDKAEIIFNYTKVVRELLLLFSKPRSNNISNETKITMLLLLLKNIERRQFLTNYLPKYFNDKEFNSKSAVLLSDLLLKYPNVSINKEGINSNNHANLEEEDSEFLKQAIESALALWSEFGFVQNASIKHLKCKDFILTLYN